MEVANNLKNESMDKFPLNYDCMFALFKRLGIDECMSLAEGECLFY